MSKFCELPFEEVPFLKDADLDLGVDPSVCDFWLAGGALRSLLLGEKPNDFDIYSPNPHTIYAFLIREGAENLAKTHNAYTVKHKDKTIQIIIRNTDTKPVETLRRFDFTCVKAALHGSKFIFHRRFFLDNMFKKLVFEDENGSENIWEGRVARFMKYSSRGYELDEKDFVRIMREKDPDVTMDAFNFDSQ